MSENRALTYLKNSFLSPFLEDESITDITYNGEAIYIQNKLEGWKKVDLEIDENSVNDFIRQMANLTEKLFSYANPILDVSVDRFRLNALHPSIARKKREKVTNFSIRITHPGLVIKNDGEFLPKPLIYLIKSILASHLSIIISGRAGSGKTEFQKFILSLIDKKERVIIIDNILELDNECLNENEADFSLWQLNEEHPTMSFKTLIKNALRASPTFIVIAEARGEEMYEVLTSAMSGHPLITTIHSLDARSVSSRMARMCANENLKLDYAFLKEDIHHHFRFYFYVEQIYQNEVYKRQLKQIMEVDEKGQNHEIYHVGKKIERAMEANEKLLLENELSKTYYEQFLKEITYEEKEQ